MCFWVEAVGSDREQVPQSASGFCTTGKFQAIVGTALGGDNGYELFQSGSSQFAVDWGVVRRLIRSYYTAYYQLHYAREVTLSDSHWYNPMSWSLPDVSHIEVDWEAVRRYTDGYTDFDIQEMQQRAKSGGASQVAYQLENMIDTAAQNKEALIDWMGDVQTENMKSIERSVDEYQSKIETARFVRDSAADELMVGASVMSGGAALAVMGGGSMLKGEAKWQDTGRIGAGIMEGAGSFVFAYIKLGKSFSFKEDMVLALIQTPYKAGTELVGGASFGKAGLSGALKLSGPSTEMS
jgi:hypothetical protein